MALDHSRVMQLDPCPGKEAPPPGIFFRVSAQFSAQLSQERPSKRRRSSVSNFNIKLRFDSAKVRLASLRPGPTPWRFALVQPCLVEAVAFLTAPHTLYSLVPPLCRSWRPTRWPQAPGVH